MTYTGMPVVKGVAHFDAFLIQKKEVVIVKGDNCDSAAQMDRFHEARNASMEDVEQLRINTLNTLGEEEALIFEAHKSLLDDIELIGGIEGVINSENCTAEYAVSQVADQFVAIFESMDNVYMRERAADIKDITGRIIAHLQGVHDHHVITEPSIVVAHELTPSMTASFNKDYVKGIITEIGGKTSHSAIIANLLEIPYVVVKDALNHIEEGAMVLIDGEEGIAIQNPSKDTVEIYMEKQAAYVALKAKYATLEGEKAVTKDGTDVNLMANIAGVDDLKFVVERDIDSVGLFRTEFLFMDEAGLPSEDVQYEVYRKVVEAVDGYVTLRTLDIGGDKGSDHFDIPKEDNPFLGYRGIRLCLGEREIFKTQLKAILRASAYGQIKIMFPMISTMDELDTAKALLQEGKDELKAEGISYDENILVGMMMETPAGVWMADLFAQEVDFFSVGTNDLVQYTMAVDRLNGNIADLYSPYDPAVIRNMAVIAKAAQANNIPVSICGEAAADVKLLPVWVGLGFRHLSMSASSVLEVKWELKQIDVVQAEALTEKLLTCRTKSDIIHLLEEETVA